MVEKGMIDRKLTRHITQWTCVIIVSLPVIAIEMAAQMSKSPEELWILGGMFLERFVVSFDFDQAMVESSSALFIFILGPWYCLVIKKWELFFVLGSSVILFFTPSWRKTWPQPWEPHPWNRNRKGAQLRFFSPFMCFLGQRVMTHVLVVHVSIWKCWSEDSFVIVDGMDQNTLWL